MRTLLILTLAFSLHAETLVLKNGKRVSGELVSMDAAEVVLRKCGIKQRYSRQDIAEIRMESGAAEPCTVPVLQPPKELPAGTKVDLQMTDHIDSHREPLGQVFLARVKPALTIDSLVVVPEGARTLLKLVAIPGKPGTQTLDLVGFEVRRGVWASYPQTPDEPAGAAIAIACGPQPEGAPAPAVAGEFVIVPSNCKATAVLKRPLALP